MEEENKESNIELDRNRVQGELGITNIHLGGISIKIIFYLWGKWRRRTFLA